MKLVHLSDLHLGFRQYERQTSAGINQREADVALTFRRAIDKVLELRPEIVLVAGDVFHTVRPTNSATVHAFLQFQRLRQGLPGSTIVMVAGNHDTPRTAESGSILGLFAAIGIKVVSRAPERLSFPDQGLSVFAVPEIKGSIPALAVDPAARYNLLLIHGEVAGLLPHGDDRGSTISEETLAAERWDYIALGHWHVFRSILPNAFYSGSIDYTSSNPWGELVEERERGVAGKGIIEYDLETRAVAFHAIPPLRQWADLPRISAVGMAAVELDAMIRERVEQCEGGIKDKIVRLVISDAPLHIIRELDYKALRGLKREAFHFYLDSRRPEIIRPKMEKFDKTKPRPRRPSLAELLAQKLEERVLTGDIDRAALVRLGLAYLDQAETPLLASTESID